MYILLVTARANPEDLEQALASGANDYLTKPLDAPPSERAPLGCGTPYQGLEERNHARAALQESARRMTDILEKTSDGFFAVDTDWNFTYLNAEAEIMLGAARDSLLGQNIWAKLPNLAGLGFRAELPGSDERPDRN
jgi:PAS domain-containing protein